MMIHHIRLTELQSNAVLPSGDVCFFIVQKTDDRDIIREYAKRCIAAGCKEFYFQGRMSSMWHCGFDEEDMELHQNDEDADVALTMDCDSIPAMADAMSLVVSERAGSGSALCVFFDDDAGHERLMQLKPWVGM